MEGILDIQYDYDSIAKVLTPARLSQTALRTQWRYLPLLPVRGLKRLPPLEVGWTPLYDAKSLAQTVGMDQVWLKDESKNPTGSIEDRATAIAVVRAVEDNYSMLTCGATGNAALSSAALAASTGLHATLFVSQDASDGHVSQLLLFGHDVFVVEGGYEDAVQLSLRSAEEYGWYNRNKAVNPFLIEGEKTAAFEMGEQMHWQVPDCVVVPVAEGSTIAAVWKGYSEMKRLGWIASLPKMIGVQAENASPIFTAWKEEQDPVAVRPATLAESLAVGAPRDWRKAIHAVRESGGMMVTVSDREILQAMHLLAERSGLITEPGSAAALAGLVSLLRSRQLPRTISAALLITGGGLRHSAAAAEASSAPRTVPPSFDQVRVILQRSLSRTPF
jgi:threonine synthase